MQRHRLRSGLLEIRDHGSIARINRVRFWRERQVNGSLRQRQVSLRRPDKIRRLHRRNCDRQRARLRQSNVFAGHSDQPARNVQWVFTRFEHSHQPIQRSVRIGISHGLMQRRNQIEVFFAGLVVRQKFALQ